MMSTTPRIAIIGGGPGGLTFARILQQNKISSNVYELEKSRFSRSQGGSLDIHNDSGQLALLEAGLLDQFKQHMRVNGAELRMLNTEGKSVTEGSPIPLPIEGQVDDSPREEPRPEIDRIVLRNILLDSLDPSTVHWGRKVVQIEVSKAANSDESQKFNLHFEDGTKENGFDLIIGADGAWSKARPLLLDIKPFYSGVTCVEAHTNGMADRYPEISKRVGNGLCVQAGEKRALMSQKQGDGSVKTYAMLRVPLNWSETCGINWKDDTAAKEQLVKREFGSWDQGGKDLLLNSNKELSLRPLWMLPVGIKWKTRSGVTLMGDAAHLMTPFAGVGVNLALVDALELSVAIKKVIHGKATLEEATKEYEAAMFERSAKYAQETFNNLETLFSGECGEVIAQKMKKVIAG